MEFIAVLGQYPAACLWGVDSKQVNIGAKIHEFI